jgi:hypothetical protein
MITELSIRDAKKAAKRTLATSKDPKEIELAKQKLANLSKSSDSGDSTAEVPSSNSNPVEPTPQPEKKAQPNQGVPKLDDEKLDIRLSDVLLNIINIAKKDEKYKIRFVDGDEIILICTGVQGGALTFETYDEIQGKRESLNQWDTFNLNIKKGNGDDPNESLYANNKDIIKGGANGSYSLMFVFSKGTINKHLWLVGIENFLPDNFDEEEIDEPFSTEDAKDMVHAIINDPLMKKAFYSQPTLWNLITSAAKGENPRGTGIEPALKILKQYNTIKLKREVGADVDNFTPNIPCRFVIIDQNVFSNPTGKKVDRLNLKVGEAYTAIYRDSQFDSKIILNCSLLNAKLILNKELTNVDDGFDVTFIKEVKNKEGGIIQKRTNAKVKFISHKGSGYFNPTKNTTVNK